MSTLPDIRTVVPIHSAKCPLDQSGSKKGMVGSKHIKEHQTANTYKDGFVSQTVLLARRLCTTHYTTDSQVIKGSGGYFS